MEQINIINSVVIADNINLLKFMYPNFKLMYEPEMLPDYDGIIFIGSDEYMNYVKGLGIPYIIVNKTGMYNLNKRETLLNLAFSKYNRNVPKYLENIYEEIPDDEFMDAFKLMWVTGKWTIQDYEDSKEIFTLLRELVYGSKVGLLQSIVRCMSEMSPGRLENRIINWVAKCMTGNIDVKSSYNRAQIQYKTGKAYKPKEAAIDNLEKNIDNDELRLINFILSLQ